MKNTKTGPPVCIPSQQCAQWARVYFDYCLCSARDGAALTLGLLSILSWAVAEIPQIITNYKEKATNGLSFAFLVTWIVGDLLNLIGCYMEPATLPTQFYIAVQYTITSVILMGQAIYYGHVYPRVRAKRHVSQYEGKEYLKEEAMINEKLLGGDADDTVSKAASCREKKSCPVNIQHSLPSSPIPVAAALINHHGSGGRDLYYRSARSLSSSPKPTGMSQLAHSHTSRGTPFFGNDQSPAKEPLLASTPPQSSTPAQIKNTLCVAYSVILIVASFSFSLSEEKAHDIRHRGMVLQLGRKILQVKNVESSLAEDDGVSGVGSLLGWAMAVTYMGGRLPQIFHNFQRGHVEGLSPLMFVFALIGNTTYIGSILVNSLDWSTLRSNLPWLADAVGCILLDFFILVQFVYFNFRAAKDEPEEKNHET